MKQMAIFGQKARNYRAQGRNGVLWGLSEFTFDPMGGFYELLLRRAALGTKCECLVWKQRPYNRSVANNSIARLSAIYIRVIL